MIFFLQLLFPEIFLETKLAYQIPIDRRDNFKLAFFDLATTILIKTQQGC